MFAILTEPLPLGPALSMMGGQHHPNNRVLVQKEFQTAIPETDQHKVACEKCQKNIVGCRFKCGNCEDYSLCQACYEKNEHTKYHVFIQLKKAVVTGEEANKGQTHKVLFGYLDPLLYPTSSKKGGVGHGNQQEQQM